VGWRVSIGEGGTGRAGMSGGGKEETDKYPSPYPPLPLLVCMRALSTHCDRDLETVTSQASAAFNTAHSLFLDPSVPDIAPQGRRDSTSSESRLPRSYSFDMRSRFSPRVDKMRNYVQLMLGGGGGITSAPAQTHENDTRPPLHPHTRLHPNAHTPTSAPHTPALSARPPHVTQSGNTSPYPIRMGPLEKETKDLGLVQLLVFES
jgi:hypothetical protein